MYNGFVKVASATPTVCVGDCARNAEACIELAARAADAGVDVLVFPELALTGATCGDLFTHSTLLSGAMDALLHFARETAAHVLVSVIGLPVAFADRIYNCAAVVFGGVVLGFVPKTCLRSDERRWFAPAPCENLVCDTMPDGTYPPLGTKQVFVASSMPALRLGVELGEDAMAAIPPSSRLCAAGATVICHPFAVREAIGDAERRRLMITAQSARTLTGYISAGAGIGESTTDGVYAGHALLVEGGELLAEHAPFAEETLTVTELDLERLLHDRRTVDFDTAAHGDYTEAYFELDRTETVLTRPLDPHPFTPAAWPAACEEILTLQAVALARRTTAAWAKKLVLGISGGLDSTLAILVMARALDRLGRPRSDMLAVTMPCFGTTVRTRSNAIVLCEELGANCRQIDIFDAVSLHFRDIGHDPERHDVTYENAQARERTQILMDIANEVGGLVVGTGDLSELALGWATYNGDHMSMYGVNAGIPKTLVRHLVCYEADRAAAMGHDALAAALRDILDTPVSPELLPADGSGEIAQRTEDLVGPYELHDFFLYYMLRYGFGPSKLFRMACYALGDCYGEKTVFRWLETFTRRFFAQQFKRSCLPDGPAPLSVSLSPRGGLVLPSDASRALWQAELDSLRENL